MKTNLIPSSGLAQSTKVKNAKTTTTTRTKIKNTKSKKPKLAMKAASPTKKTKAPAKRGRPAKASKSKVAKPKTAKVSKPRKARAPKTPKVVAPVVQETETVAAEPTNDRLQSVYNAEGQPEPASQPNLPPVAPKPNPVLVSGTSVIVAEVRDVVEPAPEVKKQRPRPTSDGSSVIMEPVPADKVEAEPKQTAPSITNEDGVLIVKEPVRS